MSFAVLFGDITKSVAICTKKWMPLSTRSNWNSAFKMCCRTILTIARHSFYFLITFAKTRYFPPVLIKTEDKFVFSWFWKVSRKLDCIRQLHYYEIVLLLIFVCCNFNRGRHGEFMLCSLTLLLSWSSCTGEEFSFIASKKLLISACTFQLFIHPLLPSVTSNLADFYLSDQCNTFLGQNKVQMGLK